MTVERQAAFLAALRMSGVVRAACRDVGISQVTVYAERRIDVAFAWRWDAALTAAGAIWRRRGDSDDWLTLPPDRFRR